MTQRVGLVLFIVAIVALVLVRIVTSNSGAVRPPPSATPQTAIGTPVPGPTPTPAPEYVAPPNGPSDVFRAAMPVVVTFVLLGASLWVILSRRYNDANQKWAFGVIGTIVGYWLNARG